MNNNVSRQKYRNEFTNEFKFDFKDPSTLYRFVGEAGKIVPARISKLSLRQQRKVAAAVKVARNLSLLPVGSEAYDNFYRPQVISPKPFELD
ncbi:MAG: 30S ribosomal protein S18 [Bdellovibrionales bacterium]